MLRPPFLRCSFAIMSITPRRLPTHRATTRVYLTPCLIRSTIADFCVTPILRRSPATTAPARACMRHVCETFLRRGAGTGAGASRYSVHRAVRTACVCEGWDYPVRGNTLAEQPLWQQRFASAPQDVRLAAVGIFQRPRAQPHFLLSR